MMNVTTSARLAHPSGIHRPAGRLARAARPRVLLAEDDALSGLATSRLLGRLGCTVMLVDTGERALCAAAGKRHDLVLLDVCLPGIDGIEVARRLRAMVGWPARVPIAVLTGFLPDPASRCREAGIDRWLAKPADRASFAGLLEDLGIEALPPQRRDAAATDLAPPQSAPAILEAAQLNEILQDFLPAERSVALLTFVEDIRRKSIAIAESALAEDFTALLKHAHALAGAAATFGADALRRQASHVEGALLADRRSEALTVVAALVDAAEVTLDALAAFEA
jgi:CheY-like chemotaxis protein